MRIKSWGEHRKTIFDSIIEYLRFRQVSEHIKGDKVLDLGCGYNAGLLRYIESKIKSGVGIDVSVNTNFNSAKIKLIRSKADTKINLPAESFDTVVSLAVIEHVDDPLSMLKETYRLLKKGGILLLTTPSSKSKPLLEFLAYKLNMISKHEIGDHKRYYNSGSLQKELTDAGFGKDKIKIMRFELGLNIFAKATK